MNKKPGKIDIPYFEYGKLPPQVLDVEEVVLGSLLLEQGCYQQVHQILDADSFYLEIHQLIYAAIKDLFDAAKPIDMLTVTHKLRETGNLEKIGGAFYIAQLTRHVGTATNVVEHSLLIMQAAIRRKIIKLSSQLSDDSYNGLTHPHDLIDNAILNLINLKRDFSTTPSINEVSRDNLTRIKKIINGEIEKYGIPTLLTDLDNVINGLQAPDLIIIAGRPGMGKTALAMALTKNIAITQNLPVAIFSLEMSADQLELRLKTMIAGVSYSRAQRGNIIDDEYDKLEKATEIISNAPIFIDDNPNLTAPAIRSKALEWHSSHKLGAIFVDYLQLMEAKDQNSREGEISFISRSLKKLAKELNVPVVALSQLNRSVELQKPPMPKLANLRESGAIEQDADIVIFLFRPKYYKINNWEVGENLLSSDNLCVASIAKHRNGATGEIALGYHLATNHFYDFYINDTAEVSPSDFQNGQLDLPF